MYGWDKELRGVALWITPEEAGALLRVLREAPISPAVSGETVERLRCRLTRIQRPPRPDERSDKALDCAG